MPKPDQPEMMSHMAGERVFITDLEPGDVIDIWSKRSGGYFLQPHKTVLWVRDGQAEVTGGLVLKVDAGWAELRRTCSG